MPPDLRGETAYEGGLPSASCAGSSRASNLPTGAVAAALTKRLAELARERRSLADRIKFIDADIKTLQGAGCILDGQRESVRASIQKALQDSAPPPLERGAFTRAVLEALRDADHPLTAIETGQAAVARLDLAADAMSNYTLTVKVWLTVKAHLGRGTLRRVEREGEPLWLEVAR